MAAAPSSLRYRPISRAAREASRVVRASTPTHAHFRDRLVSLLAVTFALDVVCSVLVYLFERHAAGTQIHGFGDAVFFASTQLLSVSSSFVNPLTGAGKVLDVAMELWAITIVATLAGATGAFLHRRSFERHAADHPDEHGL